MLVIHANILKCNSYCYKNVYNTVFLYITGDGELDIHELDAFDFDNKEECKYW